MTISLEGHFVWVTSGYLLISVSIETCELESWIKVINIYVHIFSTQFEVQTWIIINITATVNAMLEWGIFTITQV